MNHTANHDTMDAPEFVTLREWTQERRDLGGLLSFYAPRRPQESLLQQLARVLRSLDTSVLCGNNATVLMLPNVDHSSQT